MLVPTHLLATVLLSQALSLNETEVYAAIIAGVAIDLDHLFVSNEWLKEARDFFHAQTIHSRGNLHTWLHEPIFGLSVAIIVGLLLSHSSPIRWWIMPLFLLIHIAMDKIMNYEHQPLAPFSKWTYRGWLPAGTKMEFILSLLAVVIWIVFVIK